MSSSQETWVVFGLTVNAAQQHKPQRLEAGESSGTMSHRGEQSPACEDSRLWPGKEDGAGSATAHENTVWNASVCSARDYHGKSSAAHVGLAASQ